MDVPSDPPAFLSARNVTKRFGRFEALAGVSLDVRQGELVTFLGPSGCGKSTLLRIVMGLEAPTSGAVLSQGRDISRLSAAQRGFGILFQSYALFPNLTVGDNVAYGLAGSREASRRRVGELLERVGLTGADRKYPAELSGGQQQRVALARALAPAPKVLLLDEPLSALDAKIRVRLRQQIKELQRELGLTTIMVTHDQEEALAMADRVVVMNGGLVDQIGTPEQIYGEPRTLFVADFVGHMNFIPGEANGPGRVRPLGAPACLETAAGTPGGREITVCVRPEDVHFGPDGTTPDANLVVARVEGVEFLGAFCRVRLAVPAWGGLPLVADVSASRMRGATLPVGSDVQVGLPPRLLHVFAGHGRG